MSRLRRFTLPAALAGAIALGIPPAAGAVAVTGAHMGAPARMPSAHTPPSDISSYNWAGHEALAPSGTSYNVVTAEFNISSSVTVSNHSQSQAVGGWVGLGDSSIIQAGWGSSVVYIGPPYFYLWWEDAPSPPQTVPFSDLPFSPGNNLQVTVQYLGNKTSKFTFKNVSTGKSYTTPVEKTPNVALNTADFIVENPQFATTSVPDFTPVHYSGCYYGPSTSHEYPLTGGPPNGNSGNATWDMTTVPGASPTAVSNAEFTVNYDPNGG